MSNKVGVVRTNPLGSGYVMQEICMYVGFQLGILWANRKPHGNVEKSNAFLLLTSKKKHHQLRWELRPDDFFLQKMIRFGKSAQLKKKKKKVGPKTSYKWGQILTPGVITPVKTDAKEKSLRQFLRGCDTLVGR